MIDNDTVNEGKSIAITSYILIVGVLIAMSMNGENKNSFASFHIRQALGLSLLFISLGSLIGYFENVYITLSFWIFILTLWTYGITCAVRGEQREIPLVGNFFQKVFKAL